MGITPNFNLLRALYCLKGHQSNDHNNVVGRAALSLRLERVYPNFTLRDSNKRWNKEWFIVAKPSPSLLVWTRRALEYQACWEELPSEDDMWFKWSASLVSLPAC